MIISKVIHGALVQKIEFDDGGGGVKLLEEKFEAGDIVEYFNEENQLILTDQLTKRHVGL